MSQRLRIELAEVAHHSRVFVEPDPDDWWSEEVDISRFVQSVEVDARVGNATKAVMRMIMVGGSAYIAPPPQPEYIERRSWWRFW